MNPVPTEHWEQVQLFRWASCRPELALMHAIPNGGQRDIRVAVKLRDEGVKAGVPDIFLPVPSGGKHGLYIELKRRKYGRVSPDQLRWMDALMHKGYACAVCNGWEMARDVILDYLRGDDNDEKGVYASEQRQPDADHGAGDGWEAL